MYGEQIRVHNTDIIEEKKFPFQIFRHCQLVTYLIDAPIGWRVTESRLSVAGTDGDSADASQEEGQGPPLREGCRQRYLWFIITVKR